MDKLSKLIKIFSYLDYAVSVGFVGYGLYAASWLYAAAGAAGLGIAYLKPAERLKNHLGAKFIRKPAPASPPALAAGTADAIGMTQAQTSYGPRTRYLKTSYYLSYLANDSKVRDALYKPRDYLAVLFAPPGRLQLGVRAHKIEPRDVRA